MAVAYAIAISMDGGDKAWIHKKKKGTSRGRNWKRPNQDVEGLAPFQAT